MIQSAVLGQTSNIRHGFFTRKNGASTGIYASLNCGFGSDDDPGNVAQNRALCATCLGVTPMHLITAYQVHGIRVAEVESVWSPGTAPQADAMVTAKKNIALGILTADCAPILFADAEAGIIGAAHAGWKGATGGVIAATVTAIERLGGQAERIVACVGPTIGPGSYEVGPEFQQTVLREYPAARRFFTMGAGGRPHFDLQGFVVSRLEAAGVGRIDRIVADTCADPEQFFSYRRTCHRGETDYGRQLSAITQV